MISHIIRFLFKALVGLACAVAVLMILLATVIHMPDSGVKHTFEAKQAAFEEVNTVLRRVLTDRGRTKMMFKVNFDAHAIVFDGEAVYTGEALDRLKSFGNQTFESITVDSEKTVFYYSLGMTGVVYTEDGNPGSFSERHLSFISQCYKVADNWYYAENCRL